MGFLVTGEVLAATVWNASLWGKRRAFTENVEKLSELVKQKSEGSFQIKISYGGLSKAKENLDGISIGAFELAQFCSFYHKNKNPTITVAELPFNRTVSLKRIAEIYQKIHEHPIVVKDLARWNAMLLMPTPMPQYSIVSKGKPVKKLQDFKGLRVRGPGGIMSVLGKLGAVKTGVPFSEVRQAMESGVIDGASFAPHAHLATKDYKIGKWATTNLNLGTANCPVVVNSDAYNSLSDKNRKILIQSTKEALDYYIDNYDNRVTGKYEKTVAKEGLTLVTFNDAQRKKLNELSKSVRTEWVNQYKNKFDSKTLFDFTKNLFESN